MRRLPVAAALFGLVACLQAQTFEPDTPYLYDSFEPQQKPWQPGRDLNIEEVFKNYQYFEVIFGRDGLIKVSTIRQGKRSEVDRKSVV